ncbi:MAG TPA: phosphate ABC transporter substrate-binding protein [candidate division Zixibacteria bacterium]|nr:phosphate ABC transporter substrate-binding protein [candidate division Zixibacteria bacterium]
MKKIILLVATMALFAGALAAEDQLVITGSTTVLPVAQACAEEYMDANPKADITVRGGGSGVGIAALIDEQCDIAMSSRDIKEKEIETARDKGVEPVEHVVALDALAIVVNPKNKVSKLTLEQVKAIYTGEITNWKELGGKDQDIVIVSRDVSSGTFEVFKEIVLKGGAVHESALKLASNQAVVTTVGNTPDAIGYVGLGYLNSKIKAVSVDGVDASVKTAQSGEYALVRKLNMYSKGAPTGSAKAYLDFVLSSTGQEIVSELGFVPVK